MIEHTLISEFSTFFGEKLAKELVQSYKRIKEEELKKNHSHLGQEAGKFFETVIKILLKVNFGEETSPKGISFEASVIKLTNAQKNTLEDENLCLIIPTILKAGYTLRNKRNISHARGIDPTSIDSKYLSCTADWVLAELLRLYHNKSDKEIQNTINKIISRKVPLIQSINGDQILLNKKLSASKAILLILYSNEGVISKKELKDILLRYYTSSNVQTSLYKAVTNRLVHEKSNQVLYLTELGYNSIEKEISSDI